MKKITLWLFALFTCWQVNAQVSSYAFIQSNETYVPVTGGTVVGTPTANTFAGSLDSFNTVALALPFSFNYNGTAVSTVFMNSNGFISLGDTAPSAFTSTPISTASVATGIVAAFAGDLNSFFNLGSRTGEMRWETVGTAPNREIVFQWTDFRPAYSTSTTNAYGFNFQVRLVEDNNVIKVVYGPGSFAIGSTAVSGTANRQIGLRGSTNADFNNRVFTNFSTPSTAGTLNSSANSYSTATNFPASGLTLVWTPPVPCTGTPLAGTVAPTTQTLLSGQAVAALSVTGQTSGVANLTYQWEQSVNGIDWVNAVGGTGATTLIYTPPVFGGSMIMYRLRITCTTSSETTVSTVATLNSCVTLSVPTLETLDTFLPSCWQEADNGDITAGPATFFAGAWVGDGFGNVGTTGAMRINLDATGDNDWVLSPLYSIPTTGYELKFNASANQWLSTSAPTTPWEADDFVQVLVSTGTTNWTVLFTYNNTNVPSNTGTLNFIDLDAYAGQTVRFAFRGVEGATDGEADIEFIVDDFEIRLTPPCVEPSGIAVNSITTSGANLLFTGNLDGTQLDFAFVVQPQGTGAPTTYPAGTLEDGTNTVNDINFVIPVTGLLPATNYEIYVAASCNGTWVGPLNFVTACAAVTDFSQGFETTTGALFPICWSKVGPSGLANTQASTGIAGARNLYMFSSSAASRPVVSMIPVSNASAGTHRMKMKVRGNFSAGETLELGYLTNPTDATTFTPISSIVTNSTTVAQDFITVPSGMPAGDVVFALRTGTALLSVLIDDVVWEPIPAVAPSCASNIVATPNATCGNFANTITWDVTSGADGYYVFVGTTPGGTQISNGTTPVASNSFSFSGALSTTYYYTIVPFNAIGSAAGCTESSFTTVATGCYCTSAPTLVDGNGITNVQIGTTNFPSTVTVAPFYNDFTATPVDMIQGISNNVQISYDTGFGYTYPYAIFIDANDDFTFDATEIVTTGTVSNTPAIQTVNASFVMPGTIPLGNHRMRIVTADSAFDAPNPFNPCYSGTWGETVDFTINIVAATCTQPAATATVVPACGTAQFSVNVNVTALGNGTPTITDGTTTWPVTAIGVVNVGPFASGATVNLTVLHGTDATCNLPFGAITYSCPPANDDCANAIALTPGGVFGDNDIVGTNVAATGSAGETAPGCASYLGGDVWYSAVVPASGSLTFELNTDVGGITDGAGAVYSGTCGSLVLLGCNDSASSDPNDQPLVTVTGRTPGEVLYFRVWEYGNNVFGTFLVSAYDASLSSDSFDNANFTAYPNPVKDMFNVSYSSEISSVRVLNLLGQEVINKEVNTTSTQIDMSQLSAGTYIVNVAVGDTIKTIKVVKQ